MAIAKGNPIFSGYSGRLGSIDRTIGRDGGLSLNLINAQKNTILGVKSLMPQTKSPGRQARSTAYCTCDEKYHQLSQACRLKLQAYQIATGTRNEKRLTPFQFFIKLCLNKNLCDFKTVTGCATYGGGDCPPPPAIETTFIDVSNPYENYSLSWEAWIAAAEGAETKITLIRLSETIPEFDLWLYVNWNAAGDAYPDVHNVSPFDMETVTWANQPARLDHVGFFEATGQRWMKAHLINAGLYISISHDETDYFNRIQLFTENEAEIYRPYIIL